MLQTKDGLVSISMSLKCDADCTDSAASVTTILSYGDREVAGELVIRDIPILWETFLSDGMVPKELGVDFGLDDRPLLQVCDGVDSKSCCEFNLEGVLGPLWSMRLKLITWSEKACRILTRKQ